MHYLLSDAAKEEGQVVRVITLAEPDACNLRSEGALDDGLEQTVGSDFDDDSVFRNLLQSFGEQNRRQKIVHVVFSR